MTDEKLQALVVAALATSVEQYFKVLARLPEETVSSIVAVSAEHGIGFALGRAQGMVEMLTALELQEV